jgi:uncharacterized repeat protein (TIGR01451 family)
MFASVAVGLGLALALLWLLGPRQPVPAMAQSGTGVIHVTITGANTISCGSVVASCRTVQYAIGRAAAGDQILVAAGTYTDPAGTVAALNKTVLLQGGWNVAFTTRDPLVYPTTLDARRLGSVISITGQPSAPISPTIDGFIITRGDASSQAIQGGGLHSIYADPIVVNNVFTDNVANSIHYFTGDGGGLYLSQSPGVAVIRNNVFVSNTAAITGGWGQGGAIYSDFSSPLIVSNVISGNFANGFLAISDARSIGGNGGGIVVSSPMTETVVISGNRLINNVASVGEHGTGGGMMLSNGSILVQGNTLRGNVACTNGWGVGGGINLSASNGPVTITGNFFENNTAGMGNGLGIVTSGGGLYIEYALGPNPVLIENNTFLNNTASTADGASGGGLTIASASGQTIVRDNHILNNTASTANWGAGGGIYLVNSSGPATVQDNQILSNTASTANWGAGGGLFVYNSSSVTVTGNLIQGNLGSTYPVYDPGNPLPPGAGGGIGVDNSTLLLHDNIIRNNVAATHQEGQGAGVYARYGGAVIIESNLIEGNVSAFDTPFSYGGGIFSQQTNPVIRGNTIRNNRASNVGGCGGGVFTWFSAATLDANTILSNTAVVSSTDAYLACGGGMALFYSAGVSMTNNVFAHNWAAIQGPSQGGGIWTRGFAADANRTELVMLHNTVADNAGEGMYFGRYTIVTLTNNIAAVHTVGITNAASASTTVRADHTLFSGNGIDYGSGVTSTGEVHGDPAFVNPSGGEYHIGPTSAARDAGTNAGVTTDMDGNLRPQGSGYDIGADEYQPAENLLVTKRANPDPVQSGARLTYTIRVTNTGSVTLTGRVTDTLPAHVTPTGVLTWPLTNLASGGIWTQTVVVTVKAGYTGTLTNVVRVTTLGGASGIYTTTTVVTATPQRKLYLPIVLRHISPSNLLTPGPAAKASPRLQHQPVEPIAPPSLR